MNVIYAYVKKSDNKVVYVGQTSNLKQRRYAHEKKDPYYEYQKEYNYPLSRGIRKYGADAYECIILEQNVPIEKLNEREIYWIKFYNTYEDPEGYNQTAGGEKYEIYTKFSKEVILTAKQLLKEQKPFKEISDITGISIVMLSEINNGKRHYDENEEYPLNYYTHGRKVSPEVIKDIQSTLIESKLTNQQIAQKFNVPEATITKINLGIIYVDKNLKYPLKKRVVSGKRKVLNKQEMQELINKIQNTTISFNQLALDFGVSVRTVYNINNGDSRKQKGLIYPLRK